MSLVGPRPLPLRDYQRLEGWHRKRYFVLPGVTGLWQISGRSSLGFDDLVRLDFYYLENWSIWLDISILAKTDPRGALRPGRLLTWSACSSPARPASSAATCAWSSARRSSRSRGTCSTSDALRAAVRGADAVVHLAAESSVGGLVGGRLPRVARERGRHGQRARGRCVPSGPRRGCCSPRPARSTGTRRGSPPPRTSRCGRSRPTRRARRPRSSPARSRASTSWSRAPRTTRARAATSASPSARGRGSWRGSRPRAAARCSSATSRRSATSSTCATSAAPTGSCSTVGPRWDVQRRLRRDRHMAARGRAARRARAGAGRGRA